MNFPKLGEFLLRFSRVSGDPQKLNNKITNLNLISPLAGYL